MTDIQHNLATIKQHITACEKKYARPLGSVHLLAVSKQQSSEKIAIAFAAGQHAFGENYLQEALRKIANLHALHIEWHFIGDVQSNKTRKIAEHFAWVQTISSMKIAKRLSEQRPAHLPPLNICIEVNVNNEASKSGVASHDVPALAAYCLTLPRLQLRGLMAIPAAAENIAKQRQAFHTLHDLYQSLILHGMTLDTLSMGMTADREAAIAEGATLLRIGTGIFGERDAR